MGGRGVVSIQKQLVGANKVEPWAEPNFAGSLVDSGCVRWQERSFVTGVHKGRVPDQ